MPSKSFVRISIYFNFWLSNGYCHCERAGFYVEKALKDAALSGLPLTLRNFNDSNMETKHKEAKQGNYIYSSGRVGDTGKIDYQKRVLTQQCCHEWASVENREKKGCSYSSDSKVHKKENEDLPKHLKKKKMV